MPKPVPWKSRASKPASMAPGPDRDVGADRNELRNTNGLIELLRSDSLHPSVMRLWRVIYGYASPPISTNARASWLIGLNASLREEWYFLQAHPGSTAHLPSRSSHVQSPPTSRDIQKERDHALPNVPRRLDSQSHLKSLYLGSLRPVRRFYRWPASLAGPPYDMLLRICAGYLFHG